MDMPDAINSLFGWVMELYENYGFWLILGAIALVLFLANSSYIDSILGK